MGNLNEKRGTVLGGQSKSYRIPETHRMNLKQLVGLGKKPSLVHVKAVISRSSALFPPTCTGRRGNEW